MTASAAKAALACIDCAAIPMERRVAGETVSECSACGSLRVARPVLNRLREMPPTADPLLALAPGASSSDVGAGKTGAPRLCPACGRRMMLHPFGGGNVRVESCEECELVFLRKSRLAAIVKEAQEGIEMTDDARAALHQEKLLAAGMRFSAAEFGMGIAGIVAVTIFLRIVLRAGFSTWAIAVGAVVGTGMLVFYRYRLGRQRDLAAARMDDLEKEEMSRLRETGGEQGTSGAAMRGTAPRAGSQRGEMRRGEAPRGAVQREEPRRGEAPRGTAALGESPIARASAPARPAARSSKARACPVCRAKLPEGSTHCSACDSDFG